jgi:hypothetical protein
MENKYGVENLKATILTVAEAARAYEEMVEDGRVSIWEIIGLRDEFKKAKKAWKNRKLLPRELADMNQIEGDEILLEIRKHFGCGQGEAEQIFLGAIQTYDGMRRIIYHTKKLKKK